MAKDRPKNPRLLLPIGVSPFLFQHVQPLPPAPPSVTFFHIAGQSLLSRLTKGQPLSHCLSANMPTISARNGDGRYDGREKVTFRLPGPIASTLARAARKRKEARIAPWEKQDIAEESLRSWFKKHAVPIKA